MVEEPPAPAAPEIEIPETLTNAVLLGSLLVPLGYSFRFSPPS